MHVIFKDWILKVSFLSFSKWIGVSLKDEVIHLSEDISEALSITTDFVSSQANKTLDGIFGTAGGVFNTKKLIMNFMYKGEIPIPDLQKNIKLDEEVEFLDDSLSKLKKSIAFVLAVSMILNLILISFIYVIRSMKQSLQDVKDLDRRNRRRRKRREDRRRR